MKYTYSRQQWQGYSNPNILSLEKEIDELRKSIIIKNNEIKKLRDNCIHSYKLADTGPYDDTYLCEYCGHMSRS